MIYHSVRLSIKPEVSEERLQVALDRWHKMAKEIPAVEFYCIGRDIGGDFEHGAMFAFKDIEAYREFAMHPATRETDLIGLPLCRNVVSMDVTDDPDPELPEKINAIWAARFERDPDVLDIINNVLESYAGSGMAPV